MNSKRNAVMSVLLTIMTLLSGFASAASTSELLQQGMYAEEVEGNIEQAIKTYGQIISNGSAPRNHTAQALYRQGMCYVKTGDEQSARTTLEKLVNEYADQTELVEKAKPVLADIADFDPAGLMPPDTLVYMELGSPGKQVETILNMLKGTPFENPLAAIGGQQAGNQSQKTPADYIAAMLNPSMLAEFKKIRSSAVGVTGITQSNNPSFVAVLYPGKSDALRGILLAIISASGTTGEPIEGMQTMNIFKNTASVAYDDKAIIIARPGDKLQWSVKQYKGLISEPTLASSNKAFSNLSKQHRQGNAFTAWANVDDVFGNLSRLFPEGRLPKEVIAANALFDFKNIDYISITDSLEQDGFSDVTEIAFKDGHNCLVYDLTRTPNISKAGLEAVPAETIALASFALNAQNENQKDTIRAQVKNITGLDIGREIFSNIEQVTIFAVPSKETGPFFPASMGIALTSREPRQTHEILTTLLGTVNTVAAPNQTEAIPGKYQVGLIKNQPVYCYVEQTGNATIISLNPDITKASVSALKNGSSVCKAGPLSGTVSKLSPTASKLILINAGGAARLAAPVVAASLGEDRSESLESSFKQLAAAAEKTNLEIRTDEQPNGLTINTKLTGLPPVNQIFGPVSQIAATIKNAKSEAIAKKLREEAPITIIPVSRPPVIDGNEEDVWASANSYKIANSLLSPTSSADDLSANFKAMWDESNLYLLVDVIDDSLSNDTSPDQTATYPHTNAPSSIVKNPWWFDDCVEVYIDADNSKSNKYDDNDAQYHFDWDRVSPTMGVHQQHGRTENVEFAIVTTEKGYRAEIKFPWATLGRKPVTGAVIGLDVHINDDDDGGERDHKIAWRSQKDNAWENPQLFGNAALSGMLGWWKFDETEGTVAKDSSGNNHNGTLNSDAKWAPGKIGGAVELNGLGSFVRIGDEPAFDITGQVTISCWANFRSVPNEWTAIVTKGDSSWRLSTVNKERKFHFSVNDYTRNELNNIILNGSTAVNSNEWHHVAAVYDGSEMRIYVDGKLDASKTWKGGISTNDFDVIIGGNAQETGRYFHGLIDDVRIYNYALSETDITAMASGQ